MDELKTKINAWVEFGNELVQYDKVIEEFLDDLEHHSFIQEVAVDKTPKQPKKKRNVLSTINDSVTVEANESIRKINGDKLSLAKLSLDPKLRQAENNLPEQQLANERPSRVAKCKAFGNLKEAHLGTKMRYDVKMERISINKTVTSADSTINLPVEANLETADSRRMEVCGPADQTEQENTEIRHSNNKKVKLSSRNNSSIEIVPQAEIKVELLSDEEKDRMPPPTQPPPKNKKKMKPAHKMSNSSSIEKIIPASEIKEEESDSTSNISTQSKSNSRPKRTKGKAKQNTSENDNTKSQEINLNDEMIEKQNPMKEIEREKSVLARKEGAATLNATVESVYEDAISDNAKKPETSNSNEHDIKKLSVVLTKLSASNLNEIKSSGIDVLEPENLNNVTFNMNVTRTVNPGDTFIAEKEESNSTFVIPKINGTIINENQKEGGTQSSLITDDESENEESNNIKSKKGGKNEIFNPLIQSPVRKKVQAFEQHAAKNLNLIGSPAVTRVTRIKSRVQDLKENRDTNTPVSRIPKPETPGADPKPDRYYTPKEISSTSIVNLNLKKKYNSTSKLHGSSGGLSSKSSSRENSVEDLKRSASALQLAAEEKKRKREEKQKHAQQIREAKEREKREAAERIAREKQEKSKKLLQEREEKARQEYEKKKILREHKLQKADLQKNLEEIQKNLQISKYMEQKRDEQYLQEMQKKKLADMKERDLLDVARMNAMRDEIHRNLSYHIQETSSNSSSSKPAHKQKQYDFDLLLSGDSTDEEEKQTTKKPPPPTWSLSKVRQPVIRQQNYIQWKVVDKLFSVQPMTIDLQEIFPTIDSRYLKRNSSVIWSTPPRYSELPKY